MIFLRRRKLVIEFNWEKIGVFTKRAKIYGGWIVLNYEKETCMVFIPDPNHYWQIE